MIKINLLTKFLYRGVASVQTGTAATYREGSIYSGTKDVTTEWITEKQATGVNVLRVSEGTVDVNIGWGETETEASATGSLFGNPATVPAGETWYIFVTGSYIGWQGTTGIVHIEQSVAR